MASATMFESYAAPSLSVAAAEAEPPTPAVRLFVGGDGTSVGGRKMLLDGDRCFSAALHPCSSCTDAGRVTALLDSGAFSDKPERRLTPAGSLARQLTWEERAGKLWGGAFQARYLVSYDRLIDETWTPDGTRHKRRWTVGAAEQAVEETVAAAAHLACQRERLAPRTLVLSLQGVDALQYEACARAVLAHAIVDDWIGFGGWCILGRFTSWLPTFWATCHQVLPLIAEAGIRHVHIFGVLYQPALGGLVYLADRYGLTISTDSSAPVLSARYTDPVKLKKAGARMADWRLNVQWWRHTLAHLRETPYYRQPPKIPAVRQTSLFVMGGDEGN